MERIIALSPASNARHFPRHGYNAHPSCRPARKNFSVDLQFALACSGDIQPHMNAQIVYAFDSAQTANRFLNRLKSGEVAGVKVRLHRGSHSVLVSYGLGDSPGYNSTCALLDELAASMGGVEVSA